MAIFDYIKLKIINTYILPLKGNIHYLSYLYCLTSSYLEFINYFSLLKIVLPQHYPFGVRSMYLKL